MTKDIETVQKVLTIRPSDLEGIKGKSTELVIIDDFYESDYSKIEERVVAFMEGHDVTMDDITVDSINEHLLHGSPDFVINNKFYDYKTVGDFQTKKWNASVDRAYGNFESKYIRNDKDRQKILNKRAINKANRKRGRK